ncbi:hypothetical protein [Rhizobium sp. Root149]|uniref:hypothetical protein n=1 Tax=Rhizobium sp. Root149 TaxID=1736473 RepID=UPI000A7E9FB5|nr:hypothetical protein [Rhizobium sp. Root149]
MSESNVYHVEPGAVVEMPEGWHLESSADTYFSGKTLARLHNEWMRRYIEEPEAFQREFETVLSFITDEQNGVEPSHGDECVAYLNLLAAQEISPNVFSVRGVDVQAKIGDHDVAPLTAGRHDDHAV